MPCISGFVLGLGVFCMGLFCTCIPLFIVASGVFLMDEMPSTAVSFLLFLAGYWGFLGAQGKLMAFGG